MATSTYKLEQAFNDVNEIVGVTLPRLYYTSLEDFCRSNQIDLDWLDWDSTTKNWLTPYAMEEVENGFIEFNVYDKVFVLVDFSSEGIATIANNIKQFLAGHPR